MLSDTVAIVSASVSVSVLVSGSVNAQNKPLTSYRIGYSCRIEYSCQSK